MELFEQARAAGRPEALAGLGHIYRQQGQLSKAMELFEQARAAGILNALVGLGDLYLQQGQLSKAMELKSGFSVKSWREAAGGRCLLGRPRPGS